MPCRTLIAIASALLIVGPASAQADALPPSKAAPAAFAQGKKLVDEGKDARAAFRTAMKAFGHRDGESPIRTARYQNLGNAAFLADELPVAILAFRHGLFYDRHHPVIRENLGYARAQVRYPPNSQRGRPEVDVWPAWLPRWRISWYLWVGGAAYCLAWLALTVGFLHRKIWFAAVALSCLGVAAGAGYACHLMSAQWRLDGDATALVINYDGVALRTGNGSSYPQHAELPILARGMEARQLSARGHWLQIQFASGEIGWVRQQDVLRSVDLHVDSPLWK